MKEVGREKQDQEERRERENWEPKMERGKGGDRER